MKKEIIDPYAQKAADIIQKCVEEIELILKQLVDEYRNKTKEESYNVIRAWYNSYNERRYDPKWDLYNVFNIEENEYDTIYRLGPEYMQHKHNQKNEFIYENSIKRGYHGGSIGTDENGIKVETPYYRTPWLRWTYWHTPAPTNDIDLEELLIEQDKIIFEQTKEKYQPKIDEIAKIYNVAWDYLFS